MTTLSLTHTLDFLKGFLSQPKTVGAIAPSSPALARALCEPYRRAPGRVKVLEVGAGTGPVTRHLGAILKPGDELDICEIDPNFAAILDRDVLAAPYFQPAVAEGRVRLIHAPVQSITAEAEYDFVICGLPFTAFDLTTVEEAIGTIRRSLKAGGVFSYFEYLILRRIKQTFSVGSERRRMRSVSAFLSDNIRRYEFDRRTVLRNIPPAYARYLRFG